MQIPTKQEGPAAPWECTSPGAEHANKLPSTCHSTSSHYFSTHVCAIYLPHGVTYLQHRLFSNIHRARHVTQHNKTIYQYERKLDAKRGQCTQRQHFYMRSQLRPSTCTRAFNIPRAWRYCCRLIHSAQRSPAQIVICAAISIVSSMASGTVPQIPSSYQYNRTMIYSRWTKAMMNKS